MIGGLSPLLKKILRGLLFVCTVYEVPGAFIVHFLEVPSTPILKGEVYFLR